MAFSMVGIWVTASLIPLDARYKPPPAKENNLDSGSDKRADDPLVVLGRERKVIVQRLGEEPEERADVVETGTSTVPTFPRVFDFADDATLATKGAAGIDENALVEYQLLGVGVRTVSFLGIQVYVVGVYVATEDIATLQNRLIRHITATGTTLVAGEKGKLRDMLMDPVKGVEIWDDILKDTNVKTCVRIVPTRNTDFHHLRDAWVRHVTAKAQSNKEEYGDEAFGDAVGEFKQLFNRGSVPKGKELLLNRNQKGRLAIWWDDGKHGAQRLGEVRDERIGRALWLNYLAGKTVASEPARKQIVDSLMEFVERPVGTVATKIDLHV